jgi:hypothetical protein
MKTAKLALNVCALAAVFFLASAISTQAWAHCDGMDGPVVQAARHALETGNINHVLIWVKPAAAELKQGFDQALSVRKLSPAAKELADRHLFETTVRLHRQGERAGYTGLKPAGRDLGPAIPAADKAIETGAIDDLRSLLTKQIELGLNERFADLMAKKTFNPDDVSKGQAFVESYVGFIHFVERLYADTVHKAEGHFPE